MSEPPLVSIVVPCYNAERYLRESLESILAQSYERTEVLVLDDCSTDGTLDVVARFRERVRLVRQRANRGIYENCNDGIAMARGELVAIYHADDVYHPEIVARQVAFLESHPSAGAVFCADIFIDEEGRVYDRLKLPPELRGDRPLGFATIFNSLLSRKNGYLVCPTAMVRAGVLCQLGGFRQSTYRNSADLDMWIRIATRHDIGILEEHLVRYRHSRTQSSAHYQSLRCSPENFFAIMDDHLAADGRRVATREALAAYEAHRAQDFLMISTSYYVKGDLPAAREALARAELVTLLASPAIRRFRLAALALACRMLYLLPHFRLLGELFYRRWHAPESRRPAARVAPGAAA
jgi:glycosyltransferase involved in cell wall biosynthesis